jgi:hypothetical protein
LKVGEAPLITAWWRLTWAAACAEVTRRYSYDIDGSKPRGHIRLRDRDNTWTALDLYKRLFGAPTDKDDAAKRVEELSGLYISLDVVLGRNRTRDDHGHVLQGLTRGYPDRKSLAYIWEDFVEAQKHTAPRWTDWIAASSSTIAALERKPAYFQITEVGSELVEDCGSGEYKWGDIKVRTDEGLDAAAAEISKIWAERRAQKLGVEEMRQQRRQTEASVLEEDTLSRLGSVKELRHNYFKPIYRGRLWHAGNTWYFQEDTAHTPVKYILSKHSSVAAALVEKCLYNKVRTAGIEATHDANTAARKRAGVEQLPSSAGDLTARGKTPEGQFIYEWRNVEVHPRLAPCDLHFPRARLPRGFRNHAN